MELKYLINKTEAISLIKEDENIDISREVPHKELVSFLEEGLPCAVQESKLVKIQSKMESYINQNMTKMRTQLPNCTGQCRSYGCPPAVITNCWIKMKPIIE